jgi:glucose-6-phosphate dehydrogenase assembly protein OpcA
MSASLAPDSILRELSQMWTSLGKQDKAAEAGVLRACSLTLVVVSPAHEDQAALGETLAALMPRHPSRTIVIRLGGAESLSSGVTSQCWMPFGKRRQICCEQINITAGTGGMDDVASILGPITAPDLPRVLWCRCPTAWDTPSFDRVARLATRVIVDSAQWANPKDGVATIARLARQLHLGDLSWTRLTRWREMLSQIFDNPQYADHAAGIRQIRVIYGGAAPSVEAYYMSSWLTDCLGRAGAQAELAMAAGPQTEAEALQEVELSNDSFRVSLGRLRKSLVITADGVSRCINLPAFPDHLLMNEELDIVCADPVFERTLAAAAQLSQ